MHWKWMPTDRCLGKPSRISGRLLTTFRGQGACFASDCGAQAPHAVQTGREGVSKAERVADICRTDVSSGLFRRTLVIGERESGEVSHWEAEAERSLVPSVSDEDEEWESSEPLEKLGKKLGKTGKKLGKTGKKLGKTGKKLGLAYSARKGATRRVRLTAGRGRTEPTEEQGVKKRMSRMRPGSILLVMVIGFIMAAVCTSMLRVAGSLYPYLKMKSNSYADYASYRAVTEIACYQYVIDLEAITATKNLSEEWLSIDGPALYNEALAAIQAELGTDADRNIWKISKVSDAIGGAAIGDTSKLMTLVGLFQDVNSSLQLQTVEDLDLAWTDEGTSISKKEALIKLQPVKITVTLNVKSEMIVEEFIVKGLYLNVSTDKVSTPTGKVTMATMQLEEGEDGLQINRPIIEQGL